MNTSPRVSFPAVPRSAEPRRALAAVAAIACLLGLCLSGTPRGAQADPRVTVSPDDARQDSRALLMQFDRLLAGKRYEEADALYPILLESRADAVTAGLDMLTRQETSSEITVRYVCALAGDGVPAEMSASVLGFVLASPKLDDGTKGNCIHRMRGRIDASFREPLLQLAIEPQRDPNLRIAALKVAGTNWPEESHPTLVSLLQSSQDPVMHHKALQYLAASGSPDALALIEQFVFNRDPATAGKSLAKEYGLLILDRRLGASVLPLLASILRDESWPSEIQERSIDLLVRSSQPGARAVLMDLRGQASAGLQARIDAFLARTE